MGLSQANMNRPAAGARLKQLIDSQGQAVPLEAAVHREQTLICEASSLWCCRPAGTSALVLH